jgi:phenylacetate-CoA ligase
MDTELQGDIYRPEVETRAPDEQRRLDRAAYRRQIEYLFKNSPFYRRKLSAAGFADPAAVGELNDIAALPFTGGASTVR